MASSRTEASMLQLGAIAASQLGPWPCQRSKNGLAGALARWGVGAWREGGAACCSVIGGRRRRAVREGIREVAGGALFFLSTGHVVVARRGTGDGAAATCRGAGGRERWALAASTVAGSKVASRAEAVHHLLDRMPHGTI